MELKIGQVAEGFGRISKIEGDDVYFHLFDEEVNEIAKENGSEPIGRMSIEEAKLLFADRMGLIKRMVSEVDS